MPTPKLITMTFDGVTETLSYADWCLHHKAVTGMSPETLRLRCEREPRWHPEHALTTPIMPRRPNRRPLPPQPVQFSQQEWKILYTEFFDGIWARPIPDKAVSKNHRGIIKHKLRVILHNAVRYGGEIIISIQPE